MGLFRTPGPNETDQHAVDFLPDADEIERSPLPALARQTVHVLAAGMAVAIIWACVSKVDMVVVAKGKLITPLPNVVVQPLDTSIVQTINVRIGQVVKKGEVLALLDPTFSNADVAQLRKRLDSLNTQAQSINDELAGKAGANGTNADSLLQARLSRERQANYDAQLVRSSETIERLKATLETNRRDQQILASRVKSLYELEAMQEKLVAQNYSSRAAFLSAQEKRLEVERDQLTAKNREQELVRELAASQADRSAFSKSWRQKMMEDLLNVNRERTALEEQLSKADRRNVMVQLVSPIDGVVLDIAKLSPGSIAREAETFFTLVPLAAALEAEVQIDSIDVGYTKATDDVHIKLDAFPFQKHGTLEGKVRSISEDSFKRENPTLTSGADAYYLARIDLKDLKLKNMSDRNRLLPGMTLSAEIVVGRRSVISYITWPLTKTLDEAIREP